LYCHENQLTSLDVSSNHELEYLDCSFNQLTSLDVSGCTALKWSNCKRNQLTSLYVSGCSNLYELNCSYNQLTSLDFSNNFALEYLNCKRSQLTSLDVSGCENLYELNCSDNQLTSLNLSNNTALGSLCLSYMLTLNEVCVWESFTASVYVNIKGSRNVCFETDCNGECEKTEIEEYKMEVLSIFQNPSDDIINIEIGETHHATIEVYNIAGKLLYRKVADSKTEKINVSDYTKGIYLVKVKQFNRIYIEKVIVR
jgi:hypothetical protein